MIVMTTSYTFCSNQRLEIVYYCRLKEQIILLTTVSANAIDLYNPYFFQILRMVTDLL